MNDLTIPIDTIDGEAILADWAWALPEPLRVVLATAMGDVFAQAASGTVYFVDMVDGTCNAVAEDGQAFSEMLTDSHFVTDHMFPSRVVQLRSAGKLLTPACVYGHSHPLALGGEDNLENVEVTDLLVHASVHGQVHQQIKDLPDGTPISQIKIR